VDNGGLESATLNDIAGKVSGLAVKPAHYAPLCEVPEVAVTPEGIEGSAWASSVRRITLLFQEQWDEVQRELDAAIPWPTRRANVLVSGLRPQQLMKKRVRLCEVELDILGETKPCERMDQAHDGLKNALKPDMRGGVYGSVVRPGRIRVGDTIAVVGESKRKTE
jgi:MOSC domain-containing protein YiiM